MKYHISLKFLALMLCACFLLLTAASGIGIAALAYTGLYEKSVEDLQYQSLENRLGGMARSLARQYAATELSNCSREFAQEYIQGHYLEALDYLDSLEPESGTWYYTLEDENGQLLAEDGARATVEEGLRFEYMLSVTYPVVLGYDIWDAHTENKLESYEADHHPAMDGDEYLHRETWGYENEDGILHQYHLGILESPVYRINLYILEDVLPLDEHWSWDLARLGHAHRYNLIWAMGLSLLLFAVSLVYLCCAASRAPGCTQPRPGGLNRLPLDLYAAGATAAVVGLTVGSWELLNWHLDYFSPQWLLVLAVVAMMYLAGLVAVAFIFACAAQFKVPDRWWLRHSVVGTAVALSLRLLRWLLRGLISLLRWIRYRMPLLGKACAWLWQNLVMLVKLAWKLCVQLVAGLLKWLGRGLRLLWDGLARFAQMLPLTWQWLLAGVVMVFVLVFSLSASKPVQWFGVFLCFGLVLYGTHCFGVLLESAKRMGNGDLNTKVEDTLLIGSFRECADHLNALAGVAEEAANRQMRSERMKAELVTNVSHDIKTPLTSIINYVDLLQRATTEEEKQACLEVLDRQSQRMKKLIEDLMEMSKASTGNMTVELIRMDAVEAVNQALGEFSEKLEKAQLIPVFEPPREQVSMTADGRLTWRVLSNLLSNAVKYALPGTRLYIDMVCLEDTVVISLKNISRERLNVSAEELMERFVRGDTSRNTEGSGLGLNIAKSLMELQKGQLQLLVDGDLFKVTLVFPADREG